MTPSASRALSETLIGPTSVPPVDAADAESVNTRIGGTFGSVASRNIDVNVYSTNTPASHGLGRTRIATPPTCNSVSSVINAVSCTVVPVSNTRIANGKNAIGSSSQ